MDYPVEEIIVGIIRMSKFFWAPGLW